MIKCQVCEKEIENQFLLQKHFGFKNALETKHKEFKDKQIKIAEELFVLDRKGDTFDLLQRHPEINLISEKFLREIWKNKFGSEAIDKRRVEIGNKKRIETIYQPKKIEKEKGLDKQCPVCDYKYTGDVTFSHHVSMLKDKVHSELFEKQRKIAENLFIEDRDHDTFELIKLHPEFILSESVLRNRFWKEKYGPEKMRERRYKVSSNSRIGMIGWANGLTKNMDSRLLKNSSVKIQQFKDGIYDDFKNPNNISKHMKLAYKEGRMKSPALNSETAKKIGDTMRQQYADGTRKTPHGIGGYRKDIGMYIRSTWEYNLVKILKKLNIPFEYEPKAFPLYERGILVDTYTPDFRFKNRWYETKGVFKSAKDWTDVHPKFQGNITKINMFKEQYPEEKLRIIGKKEYIRIIKKFKLPYRYPKDFFN